MFIPFKKRSGSLNTCPIAVRQCHESGTCLFHCVGEGQFTTFSEY